MASEIKPGSHIVQEGEMVRISPAGSTEATLYRVDPRTGELIPVPPAPSPAPAGEQTTPGGPI